MHPNFPNADDIQHWVHTQIHALRLRVILFARSPLVRKLRRSEAARQLLPLLVVIIIPVFAFFAASSAQGLVYSLFSRVAMVLESISGFFWGSSSGVDDDKSSRKGNKERKDKKKKAPRTRAEQLKMNGLKRSKKQQDENDEDEEDDGYYPGLVNVSGTYCFMNSTLQALASLSYLQPQIDAIHAKAELLDVPTPVIDTLRELFEELNTPRSAYRAIRPMNIISVLSTTTQNRVNSLFNSREHQDAQELFQVVSEALKNELAAVDKEGLRDRGFGGFGQKSTKEIGKTVFDGLTANRRSCVVCGYTEAVMHFAFDNWQLSVPRMAAQCRLEDCLEDYTRLETLRDCICRKCSLVATRLRWQSELATLEEACKPANPVDPSSKPTASKAKQKRLKEVRKMETKVKQALDQGRIEDDLPDVRIEKVVSPMSTKQAMIARPPPVLALHLNRSIHYGHYAGKNNVRVSFPEILDLTPFTTSGSLSTHPTQAISTPPPSSFNSSSSSSTSSSTHFYMRSRSTTPTPSIYHQEAERTIYRLSSVVCHYGGHSFGHYICYRRKPRRHGMDKDERWAPPMLIDPLRLTPSFDDSPSNSTTLDGDASSPPTANGVPAQGPPDDVEDIYPFEESPPQPGKGWLRISDDSVREVGLESVLAEGTGVFMLYYERAVHPSPGIYSGHASASPSESRTAVGMGMESEETLKPEMRRPRSEVNGSLASLVSEVGVITSASAKHQEQGKSGISMSMDNIKKEGFMGNTVEGLKQAERGNLTRSLSFEPRIIRSVEAGRGKRSVSVQPVLASAVTSQSRDLDAQPGASSTAVKGSAAPSKAAGTPIPSTLTRKIAKSPLVANGAPVLPHSPSHLSSQLPSLVEAGASTSKPPPKSPSKKVKKSISKVGGVPGATIHNGEPGT